MARTLNSIPVAFIDPVFSRQIDQLKETCRRMYISTLCGADTSGGCSALPDNQRQWQNPDPFGWNLSVFSIDTSPTGINAAYDRTDINTMYVRALLHGPPSGLPGDVAPEGEGRVSDCEAEKIQLDYLAIQERAFRLRHSTSIRCAMHAAARRRGHSTWNDSPDITDYGGGVLPGPSDVNGPIGGIFTNMIRYVKLVIASGYNDGPHDITHGPTIVTVLPDGTVMGTEG